MGIWPFRRSRSEEDAARLLAAVQTASRKPSLFGDGRISDTLQGRFEAVAVHASLALLRLKAEPSAAPLAQTFTDSLFSHLDAGLREDGVGDLTVPKRMRKLAGDFYGRLEAYSAAIAAGDAAGLTEALVRNVGLTEDFATRLAPHLLASAKHQAEQPLAALFETSAWPDFAG